MKLNRKVGWHEKKRRYWVALILGFMFSLIVPTPVRCQKEFHADKSLVQRAMAVSWTKGNEANNS